MNIKEGNVYKRKEKGYYVCVKEVTYASISKKPYQVVCSADCKFPEDSKTTIGRRVIDALDFVKYFEPVSKVQEFIDNYVFEGIDKDHVNPTYDGEVVLLELPNSNTEWSLAVFDFCKDFVKQFPNSYIHHGRSSSHKLCLVVRK